MNCPFCATPMRSGVLQFDGRSRIRWFSDEEKKSGPRNIWDALGGVGNLTAPQYSFWGFGEIKSDYCPACRKMIFETGVEK